MKYLIVLAVCALSAVQASLMSDEQKARIETIEKECMKETGVDPAIAAKAKQGQYTDDPKLKKQILCFTKKVGLQNEAGEFELDKIRAKITEVVKDEKITNEVMSKCAVKKDTPENTAFEAVKCFHSLAPTDLFR